MGAILATFVALLLPNMASPIYPLWQEELDFPPAVINVIFAVYPAGVLLSLLVVTPALKKLGWRLSLVVATAAALVGSLLLVLAAGPWLLGVSRFVTGVATGIFLSVGAATIAAVLERKGISNAARIAAIVLSGGLCTGPLVAGLLADRAARPTVLVFELEAAALLVVLVWMLVDPGLRTIDDYRRSRPDFVGSRATRLLPVPARRPALLAATWVFVSCGITCAVFQSLGSVYLRGLLDSESALLAGLLVFLVFGSAFVGQILMAQASTRSQAWTAMSAGSGGAALLVTGVLSDSVPALFVAASLAGASQGLGQAVGFTVARQTTELDRLPAVLSRLNVLAYGLAGSSILASTPLVGAAGIPVTIGVLATAVLALSGVAVAILVRGHRVLDLSAELSVDPSVNEGEIDALPALGR